MRIAVLSDTHYDASQAPALSERRGDLSDIFLLRAVHRLNRFIKPDVTVFLGDLTDQGNRADVTGELTRMTEVLGLLESPLLTLPGNHDPAADTFYASVSRPADTTDLCGVRFLAFDDPEAPGYNARRPERDLARMATARQDFDGPIVALQHVPLFPEGTTDCPYHYTNAGEIIEAMGRHGIGLSISGHYHAGIPLLRNESSAFLTAPALCEAPFPFLVVDLHGESVAVERHELRMPESLGLVDAHVHTQYAYCNENMDLGKTGVLAEAFGLAGVVFTEHSGQLYFRREDYWTGRWHENGIDGAKPGDERMTEYLAAAKAECCPESIGLELDCDARGRAVVRPEDLHQVQWRLGSLHELQQLRRPAPDYPRACDEFMATLEKFLATGLDVLGHPFRVFRRAGMPVPERLFAPTAALLRKYGVAAEINFHTNEPPIDFVRLCVDQEVKLALGSDAHNLYEVGEFAPHLALLAECGCSSNLEDVLVSPL